MVTSGGLETDFPMSAIVTPRFVCSTCRWWVPGKVLQNRQQLAGQCRRNPPAFQPGGARWPNTENHDWCGEHSELGNLLGAPAGSAPAGQPGEEPGAAALSTGGAEPAGAQAPAEAGMPRAPKPAAFAPPARRR
jgi:hypothetical protein